MNIIKTTGSEGPRHDPYAWTEYAIEHGQHKIKIHEGCGEWHEIHGVKYHNGFHIHEDMYGSSLNDVLEQMFGYNYKQLIRFYENSNRTYCNVCQEYPRNVIPTDGYYGETIYICAKCQSICASEVNESAIM